MHRSIQLFHYSLIQLSVPLEHLNIDGVDTLSQFWYVISPVMLLHRSLRWWRDSLVVAVCHLQDSCSLPECVCEEAYGMFRQAQEVVRSEPFTSDPSRSAPLPLCSL